MKLFIVFAVVMAGLMLPSAGLAADVTFVGPSISQWSSGTNWSGGSVPGASDNAFLTAGGNQAWLTLSSTFSPTISNLTVSNGLLRVWGNTGALNVTGSISVTNDSLYVSASGTSPTYYAIQTPLINATNAGLAVLSNSWLTAGPSSTWNFGGIDLNVEGSANRANFRINGATVNVSGGNAYGVMLSRGSAETSTLYMDAGTLTAVRIGIGRRQDGFGNAGTGTLEWTGGTIGNYSGQDMLWNSYDTADNYGFQVNLTGTADKTLSVASGRTARFGPNAINYGAGHVLSGTNTTGAYLTGSTGRLVIDGGGTVRLYQNTNSYSGAMKINNGTLTLVSGTETYDSAFGTYNATIAPSALEIATNGTLDLQNGSGLTGSGSLTFTGGLLKFSGSTSADLSSRIVNSTGAISIDTGTNTVTFASALAASNTGGLSKSGAGTLRLTATPAYTGTTSITAGTLDFGLGSGTTTWTNPIVGSSGTFRYSGAGTLVVSSTVNSANSFSGAVVVDSGVLQMGVNDFTPYRGFMNASSFTVNSGATLAVTRDSVGTVTVTLNSGTLTTGTIGTGASNGAAMQIGTLTMNAGTIITGKGLNSSYNSFALANDVTVAGSAMSQILAGVGTDNGVHLTNSGSGGSRTFTVNDVTSSAAADLTVSASLLNTFGSLNPANLVKAGAGTMLLSGSNAFTGSAGISAGTLAFDRVSALNSTSGINVDAGTILDYTGATAGILSRNVTVSSSGTGTIRNSGGQSLTLSGTLTKDGRVLRLTGGSFNVTGQIVGASANSDLLVDGTSTVTLSTANTYNGPTFVNQASNLILGINNAIPSGSVVTLGNASTTGTLTAGSYTNALGGLAFGSAGGTLKMTASATGAAQLTASTGTMTLTNGTLDLAGSGTSAGLYRLLSAQSIGGSFASVTGSNAAYKLVSTSTSVDYQQRAVLGAVSVTNPASAIITGGSAAFTFAVANSALSGGETLSFTAAGLSSVSGSASGSAAGGGSSGSLSGLVFTGTSVGSSQNGTFTVSAPSAYGSTSATGTVSLTVLDHATSSLSGANVLTSTVLDLGTWDYSVNAWTSGSNSAAFTIYNLASTFGSSLTADLSLLSVSGTGNGFSTNLGSYADIAGGSSGQYFVTVNPSNFLTSGTQSWLFTIGMSDKTGMSGATATNTLTVTANVVVVPEPGALVLAGIGAAAAAYALRRRR